MNKEQAQENINKYGDAGDDVIARSFRDGHGNVWCRMNVEKYMRRFVGNSKKANNLMDLYKARDYLNRMIDANQDLTKEEVVET